MAHGRLKDKVAIITGASRGIGKVCALRLAAEGCDIVAAAKTVESDDQHPGTIHDTVREVEALGARGLAVQVDVRDEDQVKTLIDRTVEEFSRLDILINNAGAIWWQTVEEMSVRRFDLMYQVNARATFLTCHHAIPHMRAAGGGHIINMSPPYDRQALVSDIGVAWKGPYLTTKFGMTLITEALAQELLEANISANALWPATAIDTQATRVFGAWFGGDAIPYRSPDILADATLEICLTQPRELTGKALIDEEFLRERGYTDLEKYTVPNPHKG